ncbi:MAG: DUF2961 domain-containing protein [Phycisphaerae bacterium]|nr:DUF2961 domain-containing protein [Phycisphaerae bacterium]
MLTVLVAFGLVAAGDRPVSTASLLRELADPRAIAVFPDPPYRLLQSSSFDRRTVAPTDLEGWFANEDAGKFLRVEERDGRRESVMLDAEGPGAVVRLWSPNPKGTLRVYVDGQATPIVEAPMNEVLDGRALFADSTHGYPFAGERSRGWNLFVPIPFASRCVITTDQGDGVYYQVNWRSYPEGTAVETSPPLKDVVSSLQPSFAAAAQALSTPPSAASDVPRQAIAPNGRARLFGTNVPGVITELVVTTDSAASNDALALVVTCDGEETVWCPISALQEAATGRRRGLPRGNAETTTALRWPMPYRTSIVVEVENLGGTAVEAGVSAQIEPWTWDERSMHFHASWRRDSRLPTRPMRDFRFLAVEGKGVYVGDSLHVVNPVDAWWGEGDEKIYVDGETFPSHIGTGTEDYYGYGWCCPQTFVHPLHAQPVCDGQSTGTNFGRTIVSRMRGLDAIPFERSLRFDMEIWHWADCVMSYAPTTFWYARPGATSDAGGNAVRDEARRGRIAAPPVFAIPGAIECERVPLRAKSEGLETEAQPLRSFFVAAGELGFSDARHLWVKGRRPGDFVELAIPADGDTPRQVTLYATRSWDYGIVQLSVNGTAVGAPVDLYSGAEGKVVPSGPIDLGTHAPVDGVLVLRATVVGGNPNSGGARSFFGLDALTLAPAGDK